LPPGRLGGGPAATPPPPPPLLVVLTGPSGDAYLATGLPRYPTWVRQPARECVRE
jgi:hypothetical protein